MPRGKQKPFNQTKHILNVHEILTMGGLAFLLVNGPIVFFLLRFAIRLVEDPEYEEKVFKKSLWSKS